MVLFRATRHQLRDPMPLAFRQTNPKIPAHRFGQFPTPPLTQRHPRQASNTFIQQKTESARMIANPLPRTPGWQLPLHSANHRVVIPNARRLSERGQTTLMRHHFRKGGGGKRKTAPHLAHRCVLIQSVTIERQQQRGAGRTFGRRINGNQGLFVPDLRFFPITEARGAIQDFLSTPPDTNRSSEFKLAGKIPLKNLFHIRKNCR